MLLWMKVFHVFAVISWMVGLLYLPRLLVYHCEAEAGSTMSETFKTMERRLLKGIMTPAMIATWIFGLWLAFLLDVWAEPWFVIKFLLVLVLTVMHFVLAGWVKAFANDGNTKPQKFFRIVNEVPAVMLVLVLILVFVKPFS